MRKSLITDIGIILCVAALLASKWCGASEQRHGSTTVEHCRMHTLTQGSGSVLICEPVRGGK